MNKPFDNIFSNLSSVEQVFSAAESAFSKIGNLYPFEYIDRLSNVLNAIPQSEMYQTEQLNRIFNSPAVLSQLHQFEQYELMRPQLAGEAFESALKTINSSAFQTTLAQIDAVRNSFVLQESPALLKLSGVLESYQHTPLLKQMEQAISHLSTLDPALFNLAKTVDWTDIQFCEDGSILFDGVNYSPEELPGELEAQISEAKSGTISLREKFEGLKKRLWLLLLILQMILFLPQIPAALEFYGTIVAQIEDVVQQTNQICFTIRESSYLRESANSSAEIALTIPYDTPLEIIETIPRWYQVKYTNADGQTVSGWISKISVEIGE